MITLLIIFGTVVATILALAMLGRFVVWNKNKKKPVKPIDRSGLNSLMHNGENIVVSINKEE